MTAHEFARFLLTQPDLPLVREGCCYANAEINGVMPMTLMYRINAQPPFGVAASRTNPEYMTGNVLVVVGYRRGAADAE